ncbi:TonB-dependent receptor [Sphingomonas profundi]|uniref:TonB-dependent receptor n=1 Tax=Alterirhizorhabdus profundi TaxID=2681549 RepID=UPI0012E86691|nr:TonB-dependent receptor [Sphingomonas profundi]
MGVSTRSRRLAAPLLIGVGGFAFAQAALAQDTNAALPGAPAPGGVTAGPTPPTPASDIPVPTDGGTSAGGLEEIVVTAQKRSENLQSVPISVTAVTGAAIRNQNITNVQGLANSIPNVQINSFSNSPDSAVFTIRGVGVNDADPYVGTTVSVVVDGVVVGVNTAALLSLFDIDRVEILRGPQGTLFGANTTGGVINVVTKQPTGEFGGEAQVVYGNYDRLDVNAALNFPITESLAGKISVLHTGRDGFFRNRLDGRRLGKLDNTGIRAYLKYESGDYDATLIGEYNRSRNGSQTNINFSDASQVIYVPGESQIDGDPRFVRGQSARVPDQNDRDTYSVTLTQNLKDTGAGDFVSITNYRKYDSDLYSDDDALVGNFLDTRRRSDQYQLSQELRDAIRLGDRVQLIVGGFGFYQKYHLFQQTHLDGFLPGLGQPQTQYQKNWSLSAFSQLYVDITDSLRFQAGIRYAHEKTEAVSTTANTISVTPGALSDFNDPLIPGSFISAAGRKSWNNVGYKVGLDYKIDPTILVYGYYARGFKSGGFTGRIARAEDIGPFGPEHLDTFEIGTKADLLDRHLRVNLSAFYNIYKDMQITQNITYPDGRNSASIVNAGRAKTKGFELEVTALPVEGLTIGGTAAYLDAKYSKYDTLILDPATNSLVPASFKGNRLMNSPKWSASANLNYKLPIGPGAASFFGQYTFTSSKFTNFTDLPQEKVGNINLVNGNISWSPESERWSIGAYGRNIFNKHYYGQKLYLPGTFAIASLGAPREYGLDFKYNW